MKNKLLLYTALILLSTVPAVHAAFTLVNDFNDGSDPNNLGGNSSTAINGDASITASYYNTVSSNVFYGSGYSLEIVYNDGTGASFCQYKIELAAGAATRDVSTESYLTFHVKGTSGVERFKIGLISQTSFDVVFLEDYLDSGVTTDWQRVVIPLQAFEDVTLNNELNQMKEIYFQFENAIPSGNSTVYIDNIAFSDQPPSPVYVDTFDTFDLGLGPNALAGYNDTIALESADNFRYYSVTELSTNVIRGNGSYRLDYSLPTAADQDFLRMNLRSNFTNKNVNLTNTTELSFWVKGDSGGEIFFITLADSDGTWGSQQSNLMGINVTTSWQNAVINNLWTTWYPPPTPNDTSIMKELWFVINSAFTDTSTLYIDVVKFTDSLVPGTVTLSSPIDIPDTIENLHTFVWQDLGEDEVAYIFQVDSNPAFSAPYLDIYMTSGDDTTAGSRFIPSGDTFYWRVFAIDASGNSDPLGADSNYIYVRPFDMDTAANPSDTLGKINIHFNKPVDPVSGASAGNYAVDNGITVAGASVSGETVTLSLTSLLTDDSTYIVTVNNIMSTSGDTVAANDTISFVASGMFAVYAANPADSLNQVQIRFNQQVDTTSGSDTTHYSISGGITVAAASVTGNTVYLYVTPALTELVSYTITIDSVVSVNGQETVPAGHQASFLASVSPAISSVGNVPSMLTSIKITFDKNIDPTTGSDTTNYSIDGGITVYEASAGGDSVLLIVSRLSEGITYTITINNVQDTNGKPIIDNSRGSFVVNIPTISSAAGKTISDGGGFKMIIPSGALPYDLEIRISKLTPSECARYPGGGDLTSICELYQFEPSGIIFSNDLVITLPYPDMDADGKVDNYDADETKLLGFWWNGREWVNLGGTVYSDSNLVIYNTDHFSIQGLLEANLNVEAKLISRLEAVPDPFTPNSDGYNDLLTISYYLKERSNVTIIIYDSTGREIRKLDLDGNPEDGSQFHSHTWDGKDSRGRSAEVGPYFYRIFAETIDDREVFSVVKPVILMR